MTRGGKHEHAQSWTPEEDRLICHLRATDGPQWSKMTTHLPGRSASSIRNRWQRLEQVRKVREQNAARGLAQPGAAGPSGLPFNWLQQLTQTPGVQADNLRLAQQLAAGGLQASGSSAADFARASVNGMLHAKLEEASKTTGAAGPPALARTRTRTKSERFDLSVSTITDVITEALGGEPSVQRTRSPGSSSGAAAPGVARTASIGPGVARTTSVGLRWTESEVLEALQEDPSVAALLAGVLQESPDVPSRSPGKKRKASFAGLAEQGLVRRQAKALSFIVKLRNSAESRRLCDLLS